MPIPGATRSAVPPATSIRCSAIRSCSSDTEHCTDAHEGDPENRQGDTHAQTNKHDEKPEDCQQTLNQPGHAHALDY
jgi:hypothetical protein